MAAWAGAERAAAEEAGGGARVARRRGAHVGKHVWQRAGSRGWNGAEAVWCRRWGWQRVAVAEGRVVPPDPGLLGRRRVTSGGAEHLWEGPVGTGNGDRAEGRCARAIQRRWGWRADAVDAHVVVVRHIVGEAGARGFEHPR